MAHESDPRRSLKLLSLAETLQRRNTVPEDGDQQPDTHPAALHADLLHYKELFGKLRFSYVEQVTKEKFLRGITDNPPRLVEADENEAKETDILALKETLKAHKLEIARLLQVLEAKGRDLSLRYEGIQLRKESLTSLPVEIEGLETHIQKLQQAQLPITANPDLALPLPDTIRLLEQREAEHTILNTQLSELRSRLPNQTQDVENLERDLKPLEMQKHNMVAAAKEARRRKEAGSGLGDELEEKGRWLRASEQALNAALGT